MHLVHIALRKGAVAFVVALVLIAAPVALAAEPAAWFVEVAGKAEGPMSVADVERLIVDKKVGGASLGWTSGMKDWRPLAELPAFKAALAAAPSPTGPPPLPGTASPPPLPDSAPRALPPVLPKTPSPAFMADVSNEDLTRELVVVRTRKDKAGTALVQAIVGGSAVAVCSALTGACAGGWLLATLATGFQATNSISSSASFVIPALAFQVVCGALGPLLCLTAVVGTPMIATQRGSELDEAAEEEAQLQVEIEKRGLRY